MPLRLCSHLLHYLYNQCQQHLDNSSPLHPQEGSNSLLHIYSQHNRHLRTWEGLEDSQHLDSRLSPHLHNQHQRRLGNSPPPHSHNWHPYHQSLHRQGGYQCLNLHRVSKHPKSATRKVVPTFLTAHITAWQTR